MNINKLANRLKNAREGCGFNQQYVALHLKLPRSAISQIEAGNRRVSTLELSKFAQLFNRSISSFFEETTLDDGEITALLFRAEPGLQDPTVKQSLERFIYLCHQGLILENILERTPRFGPPVYNVPFPKTKSEAAKQGERVADQERNRLGMGNLPISDIMELINGQDIWISSTPLPNSISGLFLNHPKTGCIILVNGDHVISRKRFSCAHEYAHALFDRQSVVRISAAHNHAELVEVRANAFASALLMPAYGIHEILHSFNKGHSSRDKSVMFDVATEEKQETEHRMSIKTQKITYQDVAMIAHHFGVSYQAAAYRLRSLGYFSQSECTLIIHQVNEGKKYLNILHRLTDLESHEDKTLWDRELLSQLLRLAIEAYRRGGISRGRIFELGKELGIDGNLLFDLAQSVTVAE